MVKAEIDDAKGAYASLGAKFAGVESGLVAKSDLNEAVAALVTDGTRTVKLTVLDSLPSGATYFNTTQQLPDELDQHTKLRYSVSEFSALIATIFVHKQVAPDTYDDVPASYGITGAADVRPGSYLKCSDNKYLYIEEISLKSSVFSEVDTRINTATSGLVANNDFTAASIIAKVNGADSSVNINANKINLNGQTTFIDAIGNNITAKKIDAPSSYVVTDDQNVDHTYTAHTIIDGDGIRTYNGDGDHQYNASNEDVTDANNLLNKSGEGWLANGNIKWDANGNSQFSGTISANLLYSRSRSISSLPNTTRTYQIDPEGDPANIFVVSANDGDVVIKLPPASEYEGLEIRLLTRQSSNYSITVEGYTSGVQIYYQNVRTAQTIGWHLTTQLRPVAGGTLLILQSAGGSWFHILGDVQNGE